jgi:hypothetical protein
VRQYNDVKSSIAIATEISYWRNNKQLITFLFNGTPLYQHGLFGKFLHINAVYGFRALFEKNQNVSQETWFVKQLIYYSKVC